MRSNKHGIWLAGVLSVLPALGGLSDIASAQHQVPRGDDSKQIELSLGEQYVLPAQGVKSYSEGVQGVVDIRLTGDASRFVIVGRQPGTTTLLLLMTDGNQHVYTIAVRDPNGATQAQPSVVNPLEVKAESSIRLDLYFVQLDRKRSMDVGVKMPGSFELFDATTSYDLVSSLATNSAIVGTKFKPTLDLAQSQGWAKVNRHIAVITTNGQEAMFDSGGEFNATSQQGLGATVISIKYGTMLSVQPRYDAASGRVELRVSASVADLAATGSDIPGRSISKVSSVSNLALGESLAVAGLVAKNQDRTRSGLPYLSQIPVIGLLFGSQSEHEQEVENLVFISPSVVDPLKHPRAREFLGSAMREYDDFHGGFGKGHVFPGKPGHLLPLRK